MLSHSASSNSSEPELLLSEYFYRAKQPLSKFPPDEGSQDTRYIHLQTEEPDQYPDEENSEKEPPRALKSAISISPSIRKGTIFRSNYFSVIKEMVRS